MFYGYVKQTDRTCSLCTYVSSSVKGLEVQVNFALCNIKYVCVTTQEKEMFAFANEEMCE
jgi:hypothetical protein